MLSVDIRLSIEVVVLHGKELVTKVECQKRDRF